MRAGIKVTYYGNPIKEANIFGNILPPSIVTDNNGEAFFIAPMAIDIAKYYISVIITYNGKSGKLEDTAEEISNYYIFELSDNSWTKETLNGRIKGDGFYKVNTDILIPDMLYISGTDPMLSISNCGICLYYDRISSNCIVNGKLTSPIPIAQPFITTSPFYYPFFLIPSAQRIDRDLRRFT